MLELPRIVAVGACPILLWLGLVGSHRRKWGTGTDGWTNSMILYLNESEPVPDFRLTTKCATSKRASEWALSTISVDPLACASSLYQRVPTK